MTMDSDLPLYNGLKNYANLKFSQFHMPGHISGSVFPYNYGKLMCDIDLTELPETDNLYNPVGIIEQAQKMASRAFGADHTFFLVNGSTSGIHAMILGVLRAGDKLIVPRNCHKSVISAMALKDIHPIFIRNEYSCEHDLVLPITPKQVAEAFAVHPDARGVLIVNPDYYGICGDISEIGRVAHDLGKLFLVDEAHGAHFVFHPKLPTSAAAAGADIWVQSAHKTLPAFTQAGYLHIKGNKVDPECILRVLSLLQTSSPSYILMSSLDWARWFMENHGEKRLSQIIYSIQNLIVDLKNKWNIKTMGDYELKEHIYALDPTRLCLDISDMSTNGYEALEKIRMQKVQPEMADFRRLVFICTVAHDSCAIKLLHKKLDIMFENLNRSQVVLNPSSKYGSLPAQIMSPNQAFNSIIESVQLSDSANRVCAQAIGAYPPGIPRFCPGELIDIEGIEELFAIKNCGGNLFGVSVNGMVSVVK